jgi:hypothetical protein
MGRREDDSKDREFRPEPQQQTPQPFTTPKAQQLESPPRRPQNYDDWETRRREDDPTR